MYIVVTGAKGQLGKSLQDIFRKIPDFKVKYIDIEDLDLTDSFQVEKYFQQNNGFDYLINCAAYTAVDKAEVEPEKAESVNSNAVENIAKAAADKGFRIIHISTDYVFSGDVINPYKETDVPNPKTVYGETKLKGERKLLEIAPDSVIIRTSWLYSKYCKNFYITMRDKALKEEAVRVVNDQKGTPTNASDLAETILAIITAKQWIPGIYNFSNEGETTWYDFTKEIYGLVRNNTELVSSTTTEEFKSLARRPKYSVLDKTKIKNTYRIKISDWRESLKRLVESDFI